jgi:hypothetical protein
MAASDEQNTLLTHESSSDQETKFWEGTIQKKKRKKTLQQFYVEHRIFLSRGNLLRLIFEASFVRPVQLFPTLADSNNNSCTCTCICIIATLPYLVSVQL